MRICLIRGTLLLGCLSVLVGTSPAQAQVYNLKIVTDARPDYTDMNSMVHSITDGWQSPEQKCWALYYWNHFARRQTTPMIMHGEITDPIRQFNDYGFTQCSTIAGINCATWNYMGYNCRFWDLAGHTVCEVFYDGRYHLYDNSMSNLVTLCDGKTLAGVEDIWTEIGCEASGGIKQRGHLALYHSLYGTSANGYLTGSDYFRTLEGWAACFRNRNQPKGFYNQDWGHRYMLNLLPNQTYTRFYTRRDGGADPLPADRKDWKNAPSQFVTNPGVQDFGGDPEAPNGRYRIRGLGEWVFCPDLSAKGYQREIYSRKNIAAAAAGLAPAQAGQSGEVIYKVDSANATCSLALVAEFALKSPQDAAKVSISTTNGRQWKQIWASGAGQSSAALNVRNEVNGLYETLVRIELWAQAAPQDAVLKSLRITTLTQINTKTNPALNFGKNTVYVAAGPQSQSLVYWPDLTGDAWKADSCEATNLATTASAGYGVGVMYPQKSDQEGVVSFRMDAPGDIGSITYGGRFAVLADDSKVELSHSFDDGKTWTKAWTLAQEMPDVVHYETARAPAGVRSVLYKYTMRRNGDKRPSASLYAVRMEANHEPVAQGTAGPLEVTFAWKERQEDFTLKLRSHTQRVEKLPFKYEINVGGFDHPVMESLTVNLAGARATTRPAAEPLAMGYSDGKDVGGVKYIGKFVTYGKNLALGRPYTMSVPNDPQGSVKCDPMKFLTSGIVPANGPGGGMAWHENKTTEIVIDLGQSTACGAFRAHVTANWPWWNAMAGEIQDRIEVLTSVDGKDFASQGEFNLKPRFKDLPVNYMLADDEIAIGFNFDLPLDKPAQARYVKFKVTPKRIMELTQLQVLDGMQSKAFDMRLSLPDSWVKASSATK